MASSQYFSRSSEPEPVLITEAEPSLHDQHAARKKRYAIMMGIRALSVVLAVCLLHVVPLWVVLSLAVLGTVLPGFAVVMANDRPPKKRARIGAVDVRPDRQLEEPGRAHRIIDG